MIIMEAKPMQDVHAFAGEMLARAWQENDVVLGEFNQHTLEARPAMTREQVLRDWNDAQKRSYLGEDR